jgi:hypothetical protein
MAVSNCTPTAAGDTPGGSGAAAQGVRGALRSSPDSDTRPRLHGRAGKIFAPYTEAGALATGELADHQPHVDGCLAQYSSKSAP